jgi:hypothetical protein
MVQVRATTKTNPIPLVVGYPQYALRQDERGFRDQNLFKMLLRKALEVYFLSERIKEYIAETDEIMGHFDAFVA